MKAEAKKKALDLIELFWCEVEDLDLKEVKMSKSQAIQCALIHVEQILELFPPFPATIAFWQSVKQELLNLK